MEELTGSGAGGNSPGNPLHDGMTT